MDFIFQGFDSAFPLWVYLLIFAGVSFLSWWSYNSITGIRKIYRYLLIILRTLAFFILLVLLVNPFFKKETNYSQKPSILVMLDNSASTGLEKENYKGIPSYKQVLEELNLTDSSEVRYQFYSIGNEVRRSTPKLMSFDADQTNLSEATRAIEENQANASAAVLISDGVFTKGQNPTFETGKIDIPIFTVGLGDTTFQKDVLVNSVTTNSTGYLHSKQTVTATISSNGFRNKSFPVILQKGTQSIATQTVTPTINNSSQEVTFELPLEEVGLQQFMISIPKMNEEWTGANNTQLFSVDVLDAKQKILSLAFEIHPDVRFVRSLLLKDKNIQLTSRTWLNGNRFVEGTLNVDPDTLDLVIIHGYPKTGLGEALKQQLSTIAQKVPLIVAATPLFGPQRFEQEIIPLPVNVTGSWSYSNVLIHPELEPNAHPIMELPTVTYDRIPMISAPLTNLDNTPGPTKLFSSNYQGRDTQKPVLVVQELGNKRFSLFTGFGWFRLEQSTNPQVRDFVEKLWINTVSWSATDPENKKLKVQPSQQSFTGSEPVVINAFLNNERGEVESDASVDISVSSDSVEARFYSMDNKGAGRYQLNLGAMPEGIYSYEATAKKGSREIDTQKGEFAVAHSNAEFINTIRNARLLKQLSERTGGTYVPFDSVSG
ncbi:MAG: hypothetical protein PVI44_08375, partial [Balneolaceae bacterium]